MGEPEFQKYICINCGYIYDPEDGDSMSDIAAGTPFMALPDDWVCPVCYVDKDSFKAID